MYVIRITTAIGRRFYWRDRSTGSRLYSKKSHADDALLFSLSPADGDRVEIIRLPFTGN